MKLQRQHLKAIQYIYQSIICHQMLNEYLLCAGDKCVYIIYVYMYIYIYVYMYVNVCICIHTGKHSHTQWDGYTHAYIQHMLEAICHFNSLGYFSLNFPFAFLFHFLR